MWTMAMIGLGAALAAEPEAAVRQTLEDFVQGAADQDRARVAKALDPAAVQFVVLPDKRMTLDAETYLSLIDGKKVGGSPTTLTVHALTVSDQVASASVSRETAAMRFDDAVSLQRVDGDWRIVAIAVQASPK